MIFDMYSAIHEAEDDDNYDINDPEENAGGENPPEQPPQDAPEDNPDEDDYTINDDDEAGNDDNPEDNPDDEQDDDNYDINDPDEEGEDNPDDNPNDGGEEPAEDSTTDSDDPRARMNELEKSIFDQLSPEQKEAKTKELKELFTLAYEKCDNIIDIVNETPKETKMAKVYDYIISRLTDLKKYITDYLANIFDSKSYLENMTEFHKYLSIFDTIRNIFEDIKKESDKQ